MSGEKKTSGYYRDEFGRMAGFYDGGLRFAFRMVGGEAAFREAVNDAAGIGPGDRVLDVNCGTGTQALAAAARVGAHGRVAGIDFSPDMIAIAGKKVGDEPVDFHVANSEDMPFGDASFDAAMITLAYHEMNREGRANALTEIMRVLRHGGRLAIADLRAPDTLFTRFSMRILRIWETDTLTDLWEQGMGREVEAAGFTISDSVVTGRRFFEIIAALKPPQESSVS